jgi:hypothetical protein
MAWLTLGVSLSHAVASARITTPAPKKKHPEGCLHQHVFWTVCFYLPRFPILGADWALIQESTRSSGDP